MYFDVDIQIKYVDFDMNKYYTIGTPFYRNRNMGKARGTYG